MAIQTVGTTEALLQLIYLYESSRRQSPMLGDLWSEIIGFIEKSDSPFFVLYRRPGVDPVKPAAQFLGDLGELIASDFIVLQDGRLKTTAMGHVIAGARELPPNLKPLGEKVSKIVTI